VSIADFDVCGKETREGLMKRALFLPFLAIMIASVAHAQTGVKKKRPLPHEFGRAVINNYSEKAGMAPVVFDHWLHRAKFTCRVCHVDVGFAMKTGATGIKALDNFNGYYCGACHNGKTTADGKKVFKSCEKSTGAEDKNRCQRCHSLGKNVRPEYVFQEFTARFPKERFGNGIDWEKAEKDGLIHPGDFLEGVSIKRQPLSAQKDFALGAKLDGMPDIIFSHKKHTLWNGCELCHPEIFVGVKKGTTKYTMVDLFEGKFCGACHVTVAFPMTDCQRCHTKQVR
jgi:c(7)-type cytochrome triheme protein